MNTMPRLDFVVGLGGFTLAFMLAPRLANARQLPGSLAA